MELISALKNQRCIKLLSPSNIPGRSLLKRKYLPAATKLGQGNIFRSVCQGFCRRGGGCLKFLGGVWNLGGCLKFSGGVWNFRGGVSNFFWGGCLKFSFFFNFFSPKKISSGMQLPPPRRSMHGRYASYWNAFLFRNIFIHGKTELISAVNMFEVITILVEHTHHTFSQTTFANSRITTFQ